MKPTTLLFKQSTDANPDQSPWAVSAKSAYEDLILKPEYAQRRFHFPAGTTWCRIVPALQNSERGWMLGIHALNHPGGRHVHSRTLEPGAKSVFDHAYEWYKANRKEELYSKDNKDGVRLLPDPVCLFWAIITENDQTVARLILASGYDGSRGGAAGLGHKILQLSQERNEEGELIGDPTDPVNGPQICIEKKQVPGSRYPSYSLRMGRVAAPVDEMVAKMEPADIEVLKPLEQVIQVPDEAQQWELLTKMIGADRVSEIRDSIT